MADPADPAPDSDPGTDPGTGAGQASGPSAPSSTPPAVAADPGGPAAPPPDPVSPGRGPSEVALGGVLLLVLVGLALVGQDHWRRGLLLAGVGLLAGAGVRLVLPARVAGLLVVRGRVFDAAVLAGLGAAVIALTSSVPLPPS